LRDVLTIVVSYGGGSEANYTLSVSIFIVNISLL
jgi:hypothetical protein